MYEISCACMALIFQFYIVRCVPNVNDDVCSYDHRNISQTHIIWFFAFLTLIVVLPSQRSLCRCLLFVCVCVCCMCCYHHRQQFQCFCFCSPSSSSSASSLILPQSPPLNNKQIHNKRDCHQ